MKGIPRPSPAMIVAIIALIVAVGGTATALPGRLTVGQKDLKPNSVGARALGQMIQTQKVIWSEDATPNDGIFTETDGQVSCPNSAPFAFDPSAVPLGPRAYVVMQGVANVNRWRGPQGYFFKITTDQGKGGYTLKLNCLPRR